MSLATLIALILGVSLTAYAVFAGADFGAGILDLAARERQDREAIAAAIGPLWEANHVWLIFSITILFSAFPAAFSALGTSLLAPLTVALLAIVLRSTALGLRASPGAQERSEILLGRLFGSASVIAPFAFGLVAGGVAQAATAGAPTGASVSMIPWTSPFALVVGALAVVLCGQLAATFVALRLTRQGAASAAERFRDRALRLAAGVFALMVLAMITAATTAPVLWHHLTGVALPVVATGFVAAAISPLALVNRRYRIARGAGLLAGAALLWGWFLGQAPRLIGPRLTLQSAAASPAALTAIAVAAGAVLLLVLPSLYLLFTLFARPEQEVAK